MIPIPRGVLDDDVLVLLVSLVIILFAAELFTNGIEWMGRKLGLGEGPWAPCWRRWARPSRRR